MKIKTEVKTTHMLNEQELFLIKETEEVSFYMTSDHKEIYVVNDNSLVLGIIDIHTPHSEMGMTSVKNIVLKVR